MNIEQIMSAPAVTCRQEDTLNCAAQLMWEHDCGVVPVVSDDGSIIGMITDRDICMAAYTQGSPLDAIPVATVMATDVFSCQRGDSLDTAGRMMSEKQVRRLPVVDGQNHLIGLLSLNDIARYASSRQEEGLDHEVAQTLAAIGQPRSQMRAMPGSASQVMAQQPIAV